MKNEQPQSNKPSFKEKLSNIFENIKTKFKGWVNRKKLEDDDAGLLPTDLNELAIITIPHSVVYQPKQKGLRELFEWLDIVVASIIAVVIIFTFVFRIVTIEGPSMMDTLLNGERVVISNLFYEPKRGDIVVISRNTENSSQVGSYAEPIIKRVIATEGEVVDIDFENGIVYVDGVALKEPYIKEPTHRSFDIKFPIRVKENCVFVMGDNRNDSLDSRSSQIGVNGMVDEKYILGHAVLRVFPLNKLGRLK
jgi:signal peptidase I